MIQPVKSYTVQFVADGTSTALAMDLSLQPVYEKFRGSLPTAVIGVAATSTFTGPLTVTPSLSGTILTLTFSVAPPEFDNSSNHIVYTLTFTLVFPG